MKKMINFNLLCEIMSSIPNHMLKVGGFGGIRDLVNIGRGLGESVTSKIGINYALTGLELGFRRLL